MAKKSAKPKKVDRNLSSEVADFITRIASAQAQMMHDITVLKQIYKATLENLPGNMTLREDLAVQTSHVRRLLSEKEQLVAQIEAREDCEHCQPKDYAEGEAADECCHMNYRSAGFRNEDGIEMYVCLEPDCREVFEMGNP